MFFTSSGFALLSIGILLRLPETLANPQRFRLGLFRLRRDEWFDRGVLPPFFVQLVNSFASGMVLVLAPALSEAVGVANKGWFFAVYTLASLAVRLVLSKTSDRYGRVPVLICSTAVLAVSLVMLAFTQSVWLFFTASVVYGLAWGMNSPTLQAWAVDLSQTATRGRAMATLYIGLETGIGLGALAAGWFFTHRVGAAGLSTAFSLAAVVAALGVVYLLTSRK